MISIIKVHDDHHVRSLATLFGEMERFYGATSVASVDELARHIEDALFADIPSGHIILAYEYVKPAGIAAYSFLWPAIGVTRSLFLKELYVSHEYRNHGVGSELMAGISTIAVESGCSRLEWMTDDTNVDAQQFYERRGFPIDKTKVIYRVGIGDETDWSSANVL